MIPLSALCMVACGALVAAERRGHPRAREIAKIVASLAFFAVAIVAGGSTNPIWYGRLLIAGLALGVAGDVALLGRGDRAFLFGLGAFLLGHAAYIAAFAQLVAITAWPAEAGATALVPIAVAVVALAKLWPRLGRMRIAVIGYVVAICAMMIGGLALLGVQHRATAGAALFFASDLAVARDRFGGASFTNKAWGLPAYYLGQLYLAWSLA